MGQGTTRTNKTTTLIQLGGASPTLAPKTSLNVYYEDGVYGSVTVTSGGYSGQGGSVLSADYDPLKPFPSASPAALVATPKRGASKAKSKAKPH